VIGDPFRGNHKQFVDERLVYRIHSNRII